MLLWYVRIYWTHFVENGVLFEMPYKGNPWTNRKNRQNKQPKAYWRAPRQEKKLAEILGGSRIRGSGNGNAKGDIRLNGIARIECKNTQHDSFRITKKMLDTIEGASIGCGEVPVIQIDMIDEFSKPTHRMVVMPLWALERLLAR